MQNSQALASCDFANRQGDKRRFYGGGTGSVIDEERFAHFQGQGVAITRAWSLMNLATPYSLDDYLATTGECLVVVKNQIGLPEVPATMEFNFGALLPTVALSPASVLDGVRSVFGLNISETAEVFGITRQTVYQWMKLTDMEQVRAHENRDRLKQLHCAVQSWKEHPPLKGRWLYALLPAGNSVLDLLKAPQVDLDALQSAYQALAARTTERRREEGERTTRAITALAGAFADLGAGRKPRKAES